MKTLLLLLLASSSALADDAAVTHCRKISDGPQRLACYDAMVLRAPAEAAPTAKSMEQQFGLADKRQVADAIDSTIVGKFEGWDPNQLITLSNGQVWRIVDDSTGVGYGTDLKVRIERGAFGAMYMSIQGTNRAPKVKRIK